MIDKIRREKAEKHKKDEEYLQDLEQRASTPRSLQRRIVIREVHRAVRRWKQGKFVCDSGCREWVSFGTEREVHLMQRCRLREVYCSLECGLHMTDDEWLLGDRQLFHETDECPNRLIICPLNCLEWCRVQTFIILHLTELVLGLLRGTWTTMSTHYVLNDQVKY